MPEPENENERIAREFNDRISASTIEEFMEHFRLYPRGEPQAAYEVAKYHVISQKTFPQDKPVTWTLIYSKWKDYLSMCKSEGTEDKYMMGMGSFIGKRKYNEEFNPKLDNWMKKYQ